MDIQEAIKKYIDKGDFFDPDYDKDNEILADFKESNPSLTDELTRELIQTLEESNDGWSKKYFVADLLYYYDSFDQSLMEPMLQSAIDFRDPSFNRIFLRPCLRSFGGKTVVHWLSEKFKAATFKERIGISSLMYWLNVSAEDTTELRETLLKAAGTTDNLIELYFYKLALPMDDKIFKKVPDDALSLSKKIMGNKEYERLLYGELGWEK